MICVFWFVSTSEKIEMKIFKNGQQKRKIQTQWICVSEC